MFAHGRPQLVAIRVCTSQVRSKSIQPGLWSRFSVGLTHRLIDGLSGGSPRKQAKSQGSPRSRTAVAEAARQVAARRPMEALVPPQPESESWSEAGRFGQLSAEARLAACHGPLKLRDFLVEAGRLKVDTAQDKALDRLVSLFTSLECGRDGTVRGLYLYGRVGTGKTMLLDVFLASVREGHPKLRLHRTHLHEFMRAVHGELNRLKMLRFMGEEEDIGNDEPASSSYATGSENFFKVLPKRWWLLGEQDDYGRRRTGMAAACVHASRNGQSPTSVERLGRAIAREVDVLCFDEVAITTIQDCVVLGPLLRILCERGVVLVATSNRAPEDLYAEGLNRHVHLPPLISAINGNCDVHHLRSEVDHRVRIASAEGANMPGVFFWRSAGDAPEGRAFLESWWERETGTCMSFAELLPTAIGYGRSLHALQSPCRNCGCFTFEELCSTPLSSDDFAALCKTFRVLLISGVPRLRGEQHSEAQRWIWLLDNCYEHHTRLVLTSIAASPADLVDLQSVAMVGAGGGRSLQEVSFAVARATSRLHEMESESFQKACIARRFRGSQRTEAFAKDHLNGYANSLQAS